MAIIAAVFVFLLVGAIYGVSIFSDAGQGIFPGLFAAVWVFYFIYREEEISTANFLHPEVKKYPVDCQKAFSAIRDMLAETSYNFGDKWRVLTSDVATNRIVADIRWVDEDVSHEVQSNFNVRKSVERLERYIKVEIQIKAEGGTACLVQMDFDARIQGFNKGAGNHVISDLQQGLEDMIGPGTAVSQQPVAKRPAPEWWMIGVSALVLLMLLKQVHDQVWGG